MSHIPDKELRAQLNEASISVELGAVYEHYKGDTYLVQDIVINEADEQPLVIYQAQYGEHITFARPLESWLETVEVNGHAVARFRKTV